MNTTSFYGKTRNQPCRVVVPHTDGSEDEMCSSSEDDEPEATQPDALDDNDSNSDTEIEETDNGMFCTIRDCSYM